MPSKNLNAHLFRKNIPRQTDIMCPFHVKYLVFVQNRNKNNCYKNKSSSIWIITAETYSKL
jgi:hypothetical protein